MEGMLDAALDAISEGLGCDKCSILLFDADGVMRFVAWRGLSDHYRRALEGHTPWTPDTIDPLPIFVDDIEQATEPDLVKQTILAEGSLHSDHLAGEGDRQVHGLSPRTP